MKAPRRITASYSDPVDIIWIETARRLGVRVVRSAEVFASWSGDGTLTLSTPAEMDPDDSLAQLVFHELCHALVEGPQGQGLPDWGLENVDDRDAVREHACHRLQAALAGAHGLRAFFAVTTDWRAYWDLLPADPLADGDDPAIPIARQAYRRATEGPWSAALADALRATASIAAAVAPFAAESSLWLAPAAGRRPR